MPIAANIVQKAYVAFFNRPADVMGLDFWTKSSGTLESLLNTFAGSAEYTNQYTGMNSVQIVNQIYQNLFARDAEPAGLISWAGKLDRKELTLGNIASSIADGAQNTDATSVANKVSAATSYTASLNTTAKILAYASSSTASMAAVKTWMKGVTTDATLTSSITTSALDTLNTATTATAAATGSAFTLTASGVTGTFDNITGTAGNDTFSASANGLLVTGDVVDGGAGTLDTINSRHTVTAATTISAKISSVEIHNVRHDHNGGAADVFTYDMSDITGATKVVMDRSSNSGTTADSIFTISGTGFTTAVTTGIAGGDTGADNSAVDLTATYSSVTGSADSATLELNGARANVVTIAGIETLNISAVTTETSASSTGASQINSLQAADATTVTITGAGAVRLSGSNAVQVAANFAATVTVDATSNTGGVNFLSETNTLTFRGGTGADSVFMAGTLTVADTLTGGATGTDTIGINAAVTLANGAGVSGFEIIDIAGATTPTIDLDNFANNTFTGLAASVETGTVAGLNNLASGSTFTIGGTAAITAASDITIGIKGAALAGRNSDSLAIVITGTGAVDYGNIVVASTESISIASGGVLTGNSIALLTAAAATTLTLTGASALEITAFTNSAALNNINASGMTGAFVMGAAGVNTAATALTGGAGADTLIGNSGNDVIVGGAGIDTITGGLGGDDITGGDGADVITTGARTANSVAASATSLTATIAQGDSMTFGNGVDIIRGFTTGSDTLAVSAAITATIEGVVPTTLIGATENNLTNSTAFGARGNFVAATSVFTFSATGADFLLHINDGTAADDVLSTATNITILIGVTGLVVADLV